MGVLRVLTPGFVIRLLSASICGPPPIRVHLRALHLPRSAGARHLRDELTMRVLPSNCFTIFSRLMKTSSVAAILAFVPLVVAGADPVDFLTQVKPILESTCLSCHGP